MLKTAQDSKYYFLVPKYTLIMSTVNLEKFCKNEITPLLFITPHFIEIRAGLGSISI